MSSSAAKIWSKLRYTAMTRWLFARLICFKAPYFSSISPRIAILQTNVCEGYMLQRRSIENHLGSVHAIALCNLAELCAGLMTDVSIPADMRWIPKEMKVKYLQKAKGKITARATPLAEFYSSAEGYNHLVQVSLTDRGLTEVFTAEISMWISKKS